ncbi:MAG: biotin--[acetyl-CoA-carboxylase] ligase, partial [Burkholderiales bacterium]
AGKAALKWPNDLVVDGAKLGGILVETRDKDFVVVGIGINCRRVRGLEKQARRKVAFLEQFVSVPRNEVIQKIAATLLEALDTFELRGLDALRADWEAMDAHAGQRVRVRLADGRTLSGIASGIADDGSLKLLTRSGLRAVHSGRLA